MSWPHDLLGALGFVAMGLGGPAWAGAPATHAVVLSDPLDGEAGAVHARHVGEILRASNRYVTLDPRFLEGRILEEPAGLFRRCAGDVTCWRDAGQRGGVELVVLVELIDVSTVGVRVIDVESAGDFRLGSAHLAAGGLPDPELMTRLFFGTGKLRVVGLPPGSLVRLDDGPAVRADETVDLDGVSVGKHAVEIVDADFGTRFMACMVHPGDVTTVDASAERSRRGRSRLGRWTTWVAAGLVAGGAAAVGLSADARGRAIDQP